MKSDSAQNLHWFTGHKQYWLGFIAIVLAQSALTTYILPLTWPFPLVLTFFSFLLGFTALNNFVSGIIVLLTWPARRNFNFSRYIKILIAFSSIYFLSQLIAVIVEIVQG